MSWWRRGPRGPRGFFGRIGRTGATGITGTAGREGAEGIAGAAGVEGPTGPEGVEGPEGLTGAEGAKGKRGPRGATGLRSPRRQLVAYAAIVLISAYGYYSIQETLDATEDLRRTNCALASERAEQSNRIVTTLRHSLKATATANRQRGDLAGRRLAKELLDQREMLDTVPLPNCKPID